MTFKLLAMGLLISTTIGAAGAQAAPAGYGGGSPMHGYGNAPEVRPSAAPRVRPAPCHCVVQSRRHHRAPVHFAYETRDHDSYASRYDYAAAPMVAEAVSMAPPLAQPVQYQMGPPPPMAGGSTYNFYGPSTNYFGPAEGGPPPGADMPPPGYDMPPPGYGGYDGPDIYDQERMDPWHGYDDREF